MASQDIMAPEGRNLERFEKKYDAAVLIAFFYGNDRWQFPMIKRVEDGYVHSGQVGFPGGRIEADESPVEAALREAKEEIGLNPKRSRVVGQLSPLPIPVSKFLVHPVVSIVEGQPELVRDNREVQSIFTVTLALMLDPGIIKSESRKSRTGIRDVPYFYLKGYKIWGATAMILSELKAVIEGIYK